MTDRKKVEFDRPGRIRVFVGGEYEEYSGYFVVDKETLLLFARFTDWRFSGFLAIQRSYVEVLKADDEARFFNQVVQVAGEKDVNLPIEIMQWKSIGDALEYSCHHKSLVVIEGKNDQEFDVVRILATSHDCAIAEFIEPDGTFREKNDWIKFNSIVQVTLEDPYCVGIQSYLNASHS